MTRSQDSVRLLHSTLRSSKHASRFRRWHVVATLAIVAFSATSTIAAERPAYPPSAVHEVADTLHGQVLVDPYRWLEDDSSAAVQQWTADQNALTRKFLDAFSGRKALEERLTQLYAIPVHSKPLVHGGRLFYSKRSGTQNQPIVMMRPVDGSAPPKTVLDPNTLSADGTVALDWMHFSRNGTHVAYGTSSSGSEKSTLRIRRVDSGKDYPEKIEHTQFASVAWDPDGSGFLYSRHPARGQVPEGEEVFHTRIFHHRLGEDPGRDALVWGGEGRPIQENRGVYASDDERWVFLQTSVDWIKNDLHIRPAGKSEPFKPLAVGLDGTIEANGWGGKLYLRSNVGAPRYQVLAVDPAHLEREHWRVLIPELKGVIEHVEIAGGRLALSVSENASSRLLIYGMDGIQEKEIQLPTLGTVSSLAGEPESEHLFFLFNSFAQPAAVYHYDLKRGTLEPLEKASLALDPAQFETEQEWISSKDGTDVPIFIVRKKGTPEDGIRPTLLFGYGGFNLSETPAFRANVIPWLEAGGLYVQACLRGGGEFGREWHQAGRLERKQNVFDDFHSVAKWLVGSGITKPERLAAQGGSNGGLLVGAALTQQPELFGAILCHVPLLDMIRYHRFSMARYWIPEYGSAEDPKQFEFMLKYSPYQNVKAGTRYPATLFTAAESDSRVAPLHARKMAAMVQARSAGEAPILLRLETRAGHGAGKPTHKRVAEGVDILSFLMLRMGMTPGLMSEAR